MDVAYKNERHRRIVDLWLDGMSGNQIAALEGVKSVKGILQQYCDRDTVISKDGRGYWYRLARRLHPEAPLTSHDEMRLWPSPPSPDDRFEEAAARKVLDLVDALNEAIEKIEDRHKFSPPHDYHHKVVMNIVDGRLYAVVIPVVYED